MWDTTIIVFAFLSIVFTSLVLAQLVKLSVFPIIIKVFGVRTISIFIVELIWAVVAITTSLTLSMMVASRAFGT